MRETHETRLRSVDLSRVLNRVVVSEEAAGRGETQTLLDRLSDHGIEVEGVLPDGSKDSINQRYRREKETLYLRINRGSFIKPWESPPSIVGRDEWCLTPVEGCPLDCRYCYLQDYLDRPLIQVFVNQHRMADHVRDFLSDPPEKPPHFFSLGELSDGLFLEPVLHSVPIVWDVFQETEAKIEIRTKSHHVHGLESNLEPHGNGVFTWTLSPKGYDRRNEMLTAPLEDRLEAMNFMLNQGFKVSARIDPILLEEGWFHKYENLAKKMNSYFNLSNLTFLLLGTFRFPRGFDRTMEKRFPNSDFLKDEFLEGPDGKFRYPRERRSEAYRKLGRVFLDYGGEPSLCMEPDYVWEDAGYW